MSDPLLRQYVPRECGEDGYPYAWHRPQGPTYDDGSWAMPAIKDLIREQAQHRCERCWHPYTKGNPANSYRSEWTPCDESCKHGGPVRDEFGGIYSAPIVATFEPTQWEAQWRILTVHHLDEDKANCRWWNLVALCQKCHLRMQRKVVMDRPWHFEHSTWFQPYAAGFYAFKYLGEDLNRTETMARLDELLSLERRFTQEVLL